MNEITVEQNPDDESETKVEYSHQKFIDWRSSPKMTSSSQMQLYILPVRV